MDVIIHRMSTSYARPTQRTRGTFKKFGKASLDILANFGVSVQIIA